MKLPENIDYSQYNNTGGMSTKHWGPAYWMFLFSSVMGNYPFKIDETSKEHLELRTEYINTIKSLILILPCIFCRESLNGFVYELPMEPYSVGRIEMMYWLYLIKDKVNAKLIGQETHVFTKQQNEIAKLHSVDYQRYLHALNECKRNSFKTVETPPFKQVLDYYESLRASCSLEAKKCIIKK